jgi:hypothetical protein
MSDESSVCLLGGRNVRHPRSPYRSAGSEPGHFRVYHRLPWMAARKPNVQR